METRITLDVEKEKISIQWPGKDSYKNYPENNIFSSDSPGSGGINGPVKNEPSQLVRGLYKLAERWRKNKDSASFAKKASEKLQELSKDLKYRDRCQMLSGRLDNLFGDWQEADKEFKLTTSSELRKELRERIDTKRDALREAIDQTINFIEELYKEFTSREDSKRRLYDPRADQNVTETL